MEGEIYWTDLGTAIGKEMDKVRPTLIAQTNRLTSVSPDTVIVVPLSTDLHTRPVERLGIPLLRIMPRDRLQYESVVLVDQIRAVSIQRFKPPGFLTQLSPPEMWVVRNGINAIL